MKKQNEAIRFHNFVKYNFSSSVEKKGRTTYYMWKEQDDYDDGWRKTKPKIYYIESIYKIFKKADAKGIKYLRQD